ncbi:universal stress protein, partial [Clavibacter michiganensis]
MHVIVATDGSRASLTGARQFKWIADSREITDVTVLAVVSPYAAAPFANELGP